MTSKLDRVETGATKALMEPPRRTLEDEQRAGIAAGLASGKRRGYWEAQLEKLERGK